jgi:hypothetical protein
MCEVKLGNWLMGILEAQQDEQRLKEIERDRYANNK